MAPLERKLSYSWRHGVACATCFVHQWL